MARNYAVLPWEYKREMKALSDAEFGRLCRALIDYSADGTPIALCGNERFYAERVMAQEDRFKESYRQIVKRNTENGGKPKTSQSKPDEAKTSQSKPNAQTETKTKTKTKTKASKDALTPLPPFPGGWTEKFQDVVRDWFAYKAEKRQGYKATGAKSLITKIGAYVSKFGESAVSDVITRSMAANYQGIVWDWLKAGPETGPTAKAVPDSVRRSFDQMRSETAREGGEYGDV